MDLTGIKAGVQEAENKLIPQLEQALERTADRYLALGQANSNHHIRKEIRAKPEKI